MDPKVGKQFRSNYIFSSIYAWLFLVAVAITPQVGYAFCGDGVVDDDEQCDDGNSIGYDTCNNFCVEGLDIQLVSIPGGNFLMGSEVGEKDERPEHIVKLADNFLFAKTEVTHKQYRACVDAGDCSLPAVGRGCVWDTEDTDDHPINCVNWRQAQQFATFVGLRLPTEAEWEYVASSGDGRLYPWGNDQPDCEFMVLRTCSNLTQPVCESAEVPREGMLGPQTFPVCDLAGNVAEWVEDNYSVNYLDASATGVPYITRNPRLRHYRVLRGGAWFSNPSQFRVTDRYARIYLVQTPDTGIRLAKSTLCGNGDVNQDFDGDGVPDPTHPDYEECDDGDLDNGDGCDSNCTFTGCGNGIVNKDFDEDGLPDPDDPRFEYCDLRPVDGRACLADCTIDTCGDGIVDVQFGEECDLGDGNSDILPDTCRVRCRNPFCGDGVKDDGEQCDNGLLNSDVEPNACRSDCSLPSCGDNVIDDGEACDLGDENSDDLPNTCRTTCVDPTCGDGVQDDGEACDDGVDNSDIRPDACRTSCEVARCGDGVQDDGENCDDGDGIDTNACLNTCEIASCGDGITRVDIPFGQPDFEGCDDGDEENKDSCLNSCQISLCGDGVIRNVDVAQGEPGFEFCDDGSDEDGDGCSSGCTIEVNYTCLGEPSVCFFDADQDQIDDTVDNCVGVPNNDQADGDQDGVGDVCDNCPLNANADQQNTDAQLAQDNGTTVGDNLGDVCDDDDDNDDVADVDDFDQFDPFICSDNDADSCDDCSVMGFHDILNDGDDTDEDAICDDGDDDDDNDTFSDEDEDTCNTDPKRADSIPLDTDLDGLCDDGVDDDDDNDNLLDFQEDINGNGQYDAATETDSKNPDTDGDTFQDDIDNCAIDFNDDQLNTDALFAAQPNPLVIGDDLGDVCDPNDDNDALTDAEEDLNNDGAYNPGVESDPKNPDTDGDAHIDGNDNCIIVSNPNQQNTDQELVDAGEDLIQGDAHGDECDDDDDNDGLLDTFELGTSLTDPFDPDHDDDEVIDSEDNCPLVSNTDQVNTDEFLNANGSPVPADGLGNACDSDDDNDQVIDIDDASPLDPFTCTDADNDGCDDCSETAQQNILDDGLDTDGDTFCDVGDPDDDNDTFSDEDEETCGTLPKDGNSVPTDTDGDTLCDDGVDDDDDNDTLLDVEEDANGNGQYDAATETDSKNADTDDDGVDDNEDNCPITPNEDQLNTDAHFASLNNPLVLRDELGDACDPNDDNDALTDEEEDLNNNGVYDVGIESDPKHPDTDGDAHVDGNDNCLLTNNPNQLNTDQELVDAGNTLIVGDLNGDECDDDDDNDGLLDTFELGVSSTSPFNPDHDGDNIIDSEDNCRLVSNPAQTNTDKDLNADGQPVVADEEGDACDGDDDNDGVVDIDDNSPLDPFRCTDIDNDTCDDCSVVAQQNFLNDGLDTDQDTLCDQGDPDDDNDDFSDEDEVTCGSLPRNFASVPTDTDGDGFCDNGVDDDDDNDTLTDAEEDTDGDGFHDLGLETSTTNPDTDGDGVRDDQDNCPLVPNANQVNTDAIFAAQANPLIQGDEFGDACDDDDDNDGVSDEDEDSNNNNQFDNGTETNPLNPDSDGDSIIDGNDNCALVNNPDQSNTDQDLVDAGNQLIQGDPQGDACDDDDDNDGLTDTFELATSSTSPFNPDHDGDNIIDSDDNCPLLNNPNQINTDAAIFEGGTVVERDTLGDACDNDDDGDTVLDFDDNAPLDPFRCTDLDNDGCDDCSVAANQSIINDGVDTDGDTICDEGDPDDDEDGFTDEDEVTCGSLPLNKNSVPVDTDDDGLCDNGVDPDDDNDGLTDEEEDLDNDGFYDIGVETNPKNPDTDGDTIGDKEDNCQLTPNSDQRNTDADRANNPNAVVEGDAFGDACDDNDDNDLLTDEEEDLNNDGVYNVGIETDPKDPDTDGDFILDGGDNCPLTANADQQNTDEALVNAGSQLIVSDPLGDACDDDDDNDGLDDVDEFNLTDFRNPDTDGDGVIDGDDNCPLVQNANQTNTDVALQNIPGSPIIGDGEGDACDGDDDNDEVLDIDDLDPLDPFVCKDDEGDGCDDCVIEAKPNIINDGPDLDGDTLCDAFDPDDDGDGFSDVDETECGTDNRSFASRPLDTDGDTLCDNGVDDDDDNDNLLDAQEDANGNGVVDQGETNPKLADTDSDGTQDDQDNCPVDHNFDQLNTDANLAQQQNALVQGDSLGDVCDPNDDNDALTDAQEDSNDNGFYDPGLETNPKDPDTDDDNFIDGNDNCPLTVNPDQTNTDAVLATDPANGVDGDEFGNACDDDDDNDTLTDAEEIAIGTTLTDPDTDNDGRHDNVDNCPLDSNPNQNDNDGDNIGDACDDDDDNDTVIDTQDSAPFNANQCRDLDGDSCDDCSQLNRPDVNNDGLDTDGDGSCNLGDLDDDNDQFSDAHEIVCGSDPLLANQRPLDTDGDGLCDDGIDSDDDNDTIPDIVEDPNDIGVLNDGETNPKDPDTDDDGVRDDDDNCPRAPNANQLNTDANLEQQANALVQGDSLGDACDDDDDNDGLNDDEEDIDGDGIQDPGETRPLDPDTDDDSIIDGDDNCTLIVNPEQFDNDIADGEDGGDACDDDDDNDGLSDVDEINAGTGPFNPNTDGDAFLDGDDNCPLVINNIQSDFDNDGLGNACDPDDDNDTVEDGDDADPLDKFSCQDSDDDGCDDCAIAGTPDTNNDGFDRDGDGLCDAGDPDEDDDGFSNIDEIKCGSEPDDPTSTPLDTDGDSFCDFGVDTDDDNDGLPDVEEDLNNNNIHDPGETDLRDADTDDDGDLDSADNCPLVPNPNQLNTDATLASQPNALVAGDAEGDACDDDDDNDGIDDIDEDANNNNNFDPATETNPLDPDTDNDGDLDGADNCPLTPNGNQLNTDGQDDGGNACDDDDDDDGLTDEEEGQLGTNPVNRNTDGDAHEDAVDNCPLNPNNDQFNSDNTDDGGDACDDDDDNDTVPDLDDADQFDPLKCRDQDGDGCDDCSVTGTPQVNNDGPDNDGDGQCDDSDDDDDNDTFSDADEVTCQSNPLINADRPADHDGDGLCSNGVDDDDDNDGVLDVNDLFRLDPNRCSDLDNDQCDDCASGTFNTQNDGPDADGDGFGDDFDGDGACDLGDDDDDNDNFTDVEENACQSDPKNFASRPIDSDGDGTCDPIDVCPSLSDNQADLDNDGEGDACDCGDFSDVGVGEECDGGGVDTAECDLDCTLAVCGDAHVNAASNEQCDDGNNNNSDDCIDGIGGDCTFAFCGDSFLRTNSVDPANNEECDDGNQVNGDGCDSNCRIEVCGNGVRQQGEGCDDGNNSTNDECIDGPDQACTVAFCGDSFLLRVSDDPAKLEECDDGNQVNGDGCNSSCQFEAPCFEVDACPTIEYRQLPAGSFTMGDNNLGHTSPEHTVNVPAFQIGRTEVTVGQYRLCVENGPCEAPLVKENQNNKSNYQLSDEGRIDGENYPMNDVDWEMAQDFAAWIGARLPSESEWEYAATSGGLPHRFAWGNDQISCDLAIYKDIAADVTSEGCGTRLSHPVCSRSPLGPILGETQQGLCDMNGNLEEWVEDRYVNNYNEAPNDGSAYDYDCNIQVDGIACFNRTLRGGAYTFVEQQITNRQRQGRVYVSNSLLTGFRVVKNY